ncbi:Mucin-21 [Lambiella insularis]|nr:Mucin-21 [Lambiella insularis]
MTSAAVAALEQSPRSKNTELLVENLFGFAPGNDGSLRVTDKFKQLKDAINKSPIAYGLYCDGSAFTWVEEWQEDDPKADPPHKKGDPLTNKPKSLGGNGKFYATRKPPNTPALYIDAEKRENLCQTPTSLGDGVLQGLSPPSSGIVVLCPGAFGTEGFYNKNGNGRALGDAVNQVAPAGISIDEYASTGNILLHELTHAVLGTKDVVMGNGKSAYIPFYIILLARQFKNGKARAGNGPIQNANTYSDFALAVYLSKNSWALGKAAPAISDSGSSKFADKPKKLRGRHLFKNPIPRVMRALVSQSYSLSVRAPPSIPKPTKQPQRPPPNQKPNPKQEAMQKHQPTRKYDVTANAKTVPKQQAPTGSLVVEISDGQIQAPLPTLGSMYVPGFFQAGSMAFTGDPTAGFNVDGTTVRMGGPAVTVSGNTISLQSSGRVIIDGSSRQMTTVTVGPIPQPTVTALITRTASGGEVVACVPELTLSAKSTVTQCRGSWRTTIYTGAAQTHQTGPPSGSTKSLASTRAPESTEKQSTKGPSASTHPASAVSKFTSPSLQHSTKSGSQTLPPGASVVVSESGSLTFKETFLLTTYQQFTALTKQTQIHASVAPGRSEALIIGPGGLGYQIPSLSSGQPQLIPPTNLPSITRLAVGSTQTRPSRSGSRSVTRSEPTPVAPSNTRVSKQPSPNVVPSVLLTATASNGYTVTTLVPPISITTTVTTPPPGFTVSTTTNTAWTSNTVVVISGTTYPVLVNCGGLCGPPGSSIILGGLGGLPSDPVRPGCGGGGLLGLFRSIFSCGTLFNFPKFPPFTINIDGVPEPGPDPGQKPSPSSPKPSQSQGSSSGKRSTTSHSSCSRTSVVSDCSVRCTATAKTQSCKTTCYSTITGCVTGVTTTVTGTATNVGYLMVTEEAAVIDSGPFTMDPSLSSEISAEDASILGSASKSLSGKASQTKASQTKASQTRASQTKASQTKASYTGVTTKSLPKTLSKSDVQTPTTRATGITPAGPKSSPVASSPPLGPLPTPSCQFATETSFNLPAFNGALPLFCAYNQPIKPGQSQQLTGTDCSTNNDFTLSVAYTGGPKCPSSITLADNSGALCTKIFQELLACQQPVQGLYSGGSITYDCATWTLGPFSPATVKQCPQNFVPPIVCKSVDDCKCPQNLGSCVKGSCYCNATPISVSLNEPALQTIAACLGDPIGCVLGGP